MGWGYHIGLAIILACALVALCIGQTEAAAFVLGVIVGHHCLMAFTTYGDE